MSEARTDHGGLRWGRRATLTHALPGHGNEVLLLLVVGARVRERDLDTKQNTFN